MHYNKWLKENPKFEDEQNEMMVRAQEAADAGNEEWMLDEWFPSPLCPVCGWELIPVEDGRMICPDCGHEEGEDNDPAAELAALNSTRYTIHVERGDEPEPAEPQDMGQRLPF